MNLDEIKRYIAIGRNRAIIIDISRDNLFPSFIREVTLIADHVTLISYSDFDLEEPFVRFRGRYNTLETMVSDLELYLGKSIGQWENYSKTGNYPEPLTEEMRHGIDMQEFLRSINLPSSGKYEKL